MSGKRESELITRLKELYRSPPQVFPATVKRINNEESEHTTIDVEDAHERVFFDVRIKASMNENSQGINYIPEIGSEVLIGLIENSDHALYIAKTDTLKEVRGIIGKSSFKMTSSEITINNSGNDSNGGILIAEKVIEGINTIKEDLTKLKDEIGGWTSPPVPVTPPAMGDGAIVLITDLKTWAKDPLEEIDLETVTNNLVKH